MKINSAVLKLTAFYVLVLMVISITFSVSIYQISSVEIGRGLGRQGQMLRGLRQTLDNHLIEDFEELRKEQTAESLAALKRNLIYYNLLLLLLSGFGSYFFARWTLRPLEDAVEEQNRFTADASHELKTPLAAIKSEIEVNLRDKKFDLSDARKLLESNLEEIEKLQDLTVALLKLSKFDEIERLNFSIENLDEIVTEAYEKIEPLAKKKNIEVDAELVDSRILADRISLVELFVILLENAVKYSSANSKINLKIIKDGNDYIVKIKDRGPGLKRSEIPHIFDRFYRADQSRNKEKADGFGLGLSIAKRIADLHKAKISVESTPGKGSEFQVRF